VSLVCKELGELVDFKGGGTPNRNIEEYWGNLIPWATVKDLNEGITLTNTQEFITELGLKNSASNLIPKGSIIIPTRMALGKVVISEIDVAINQDLKAVLVKNNELLDTKYLLWFLASNKENIASMGKGATVKGITLDQLRAIKIPLPPLAEQRRIASILDKADELRQKRQQAIEKLDQLLQATFIDMFGDPVSNPKGWQKDELQNICMQVIDCPHSTPTWSDEGIICLRTSNLGKGEWIWDDTRYVSPLEYIERTKRSEIFAGDIILSREGTVGIAAIVPNDLKLSLGQRLVQLTPKLDKVNSEFLLQVLLYDLDPIRISSLMVGSTSKHINVKDLRGLKLFVPPIELQNKFSSISLKISQQKKELKTSLSNFDNLFKALQNQTFSRNL
jgi:type I restriction enzyme S subunit